MKGLPEPTLTQSEAARRLGLSVKTVRRMLDRGDLTAVASGERGGALRVLHDRKLDTYLSDSSSRESDTLPRKSDTPAAHTRTRLAKAPTAAAQTTRAPSEKPAAAAGIVAPFAHAPSDRHTPVIGSTQTRTTGAKPAAGELLDDDWVQLEPRSQTHAEPAPRLRRFQRAWRGVLALAVLLVASALAANALHSGGGTGVGTTRPASAPIAAHAGSRGARAFEIPAVPAGRGGLASVFRQVTPAATLNGASTAGRNTRPTHTTPLHPPGCDTVLSAEGLC